MNARLLLNLGLLALFVALGWVTFKVDVPPPATPGVALTALAIDRIKTIRIERDGSTAAQLRRRGDVWHLETPIGATADAFRVQALLGLARARSSEGFRAAGNDLTQYGLQPPRATVRFDAKALLIGDTDPVAGRRYVMSGDQVHLLEDNWFAQIFGDGIAWLDPRPLPAGALPLRIELRDSPHDAPWPAAQWQQRDGHWQRTPAASTAPAHAIEQRGAALAAAWAQARALSVQRRDATLAWRGQVLVAFRSPLRSPAKPDSAAGPSASQKSDGTDTLIFAVARSDDALFLARDDLGIQYRFLGRQGNALLGVDISQ